MKAVRIHAYGGSEMLAYEDAPCPEVGKDELLVRVAATSVNPFDCAARSGYVSAYYPYDMPHILGLDVSGVVEATGPGVQGFSVGDAVFGRPHPSRNGAYAEYISLPASVAAPKPKSLDFIHAAAVPHAAVAAWRALFDMGKLEAGQRVLIHGAAGGVGTMAVQLAKHRGAHVIGTSSAGNLEYLRSLGADQAIDYNATRFEEVVSDLDLVIDLVGDMADNTQQRSWKLLRPGGILASCIQFPSPEEAAAHGVQGYMVNGEQADTQLLNELGALIDSGKLVPVVSTILPLAEAQKGHQLSESRHVRGKIILQVAEL